MPREAVIIIPARHASSRYPGKPLVGLRGAGGHERPLILRSWDAACAVPDISGVWVATDDRRIADVARAGGAQVVMTSATCVNGTERCADALARLGIAPDVVVNLQGDAPLTPPWFVSALIDAVGNDTPVATPVLRCTPAIHRQLVEDRAAGRPGATTAVFDRFGRALYFSKNVLPYAPEPVTAMTEAPVFHHVGVYAYTPQALAEYVAAPPSTPEQMEGLEQLRFLHLGLSVRCIVVDAKGHAFWELNNPADKPRIEAILRAQGID